MAETRPWANYDNYAVSWGTNGHPIKIVDTTSNTYLQPYTRYTEFLHWDGDVLPFTSSTASGTPDNIKIGSFAELRPSDGTIQVFDRDSAGQIEDSHTTSQNTQGGSYNDLLETWEGGTPSLGNISEPKGTSLRAWGLFSIEGVRGVDDGLGQYERPVDLVCSSQASMKVFRLSADYDAKGNDRYRSLCPVVQHDREMLGIWLFEGARVADVWSDQARLVEFLDKRRPRSDFVRYIGLGAFAVTERTADLISPILAAAGEILPVSTHAGERFYLVNVVPLLDCLDASKTLGERTSRGEFAFVRRYAFDATRLPRRSLFKVKELPTDIFLKQGTVAPELDLRTQVEHLKLTGLMFIEVWNDDGQEIPDFEEFEKVFPPH